MDLDLILVGGGLQNSLVVLAVLDAQPRARIAVIERGLSLGGNHTWCFHELDVAAIHRPWFNPIVAHRWPAYDVDFPTLRRTLQHEYAAVTSDTLDRVVRAKVAASPGVSMLLGCEVERVGAGEVRLRDGRLLKAPLVVDARGPQANRDPGAPCGYQKFVGLEVELAKPEPGVRPILMDSTVPQIDGYRFLYTLPFSPTRFLIEDTYFSETPSLDDDILRKRALQYADERGWKVQHVVREERGVLPMPWNAEADTSIPGLLVAGYGGGWFHPATGYSLPVAVRLAHHIAAHPPDQVIGGALDELRQAHRSQQRFCHLLNFMMFRAVAASERWGLFARFYGLADDTIQRFYALTMTMRDRARLLKGRPPKGFSFKALLAGVVKS